jgi:hypothetical protein
LPDIIILLINFSIFLSINTLFLYLTFQILLFLPKLFKF